MKGLAQTLADAGRTDLVQIGEAMAFLMSEEGINALTMPPEVLSVRTRCTLDECMSFLCDDVVNHWINERIKLDTKQTHKKALIDLNKEGLKTVDIQKAKLMIEQMDKDKQDNSKQFIIIRQDCMPDEEELI